jgi:hypothetical protein
MIRVPILEEREPLRTARGKMSIKVHAGVGLSSADDSETAGREAASVALTGLENCVPALVVVYAALRYDARSLLRGIRAITGGTPLIGATSSGHFAGGTYIPAGAGVAVLVLSAGMYRFGVASVEKISSDMEGVGRQLARASREAAGGGQQGAILVLADGLVAELCDHQQLIAGIYRVTGLRIPTVGGVASDEFTMSGTAVFHDDAVLDGGAVAVWIASEQPLRVVTGHGWTPIGRPMLVDRVLGTQIMEIGGRPAFDAYAEQLASIGEVVDHTSRFWDTGYRHPLGLLQPNGSTLIRVPEHRVDDGSLWLHSPVPAGAAIQVMGGSADSLLAQAGPVAEAAVGSCQEPGVLLAFSCAARVAACGARIEEEPALLQAAAGVPTFGFYTYGEFARTVGTLGVHNATITALAL